MNRRTWLEWATWLVAAGCAAVLAVPGVSYVLDPFRRKSSASGEFRRLAKLSDLAVGVPKKITIQGSRQDAWTSFDKEVIGRVWLVRQSAADVPPQETKLEAFSAVCPHLRCDIQMNRADNKFICPCHKAVFHLNGKKASAEELKYVNPSPRDMDLLQCRVVQDEQSKQWWVEVLYEKFHYGVTEKTAVT